MAHFEKCLLGKPKDFHPIEEDRVCFGSMEPKQDGVAVASVYRFVLSQTTRCRESPKSVLRVGNMRVAETLVLLGSCQGNPVH